MTGNEDSAEFNAYPEARTISLPAGCRVAKNRRLFGRETIRRDAHRRNANIIRHGNVDVDRRTG